MDTLDFVCILSWNKINEHRHKQTSKQANNQTFIHSENSVGCVCVPNWYHSISKGNHRNKQCNKWWGLLCEQILCIHTQHTHIQLNNDAVHYIRSHINTHTYERARGRTHKQQYKSGCETRTALSKSLIFHVYVLYGIPHVYTGIEYTYTLLFYSFIHINQINLNISTV